MFLLQPVHSTKLRWLHKNLTVACNQGTILILTLSRLTWRSMSACTLGTPNAHVSVHKPCKKHLRREGGGKGTYLVRWSLKALRVYGSLGRPCSLRASQLDRNEAASAGTTRPFSEWHCRIKEIDRGPFPRLA